MVVFGKNSTQYDLFDDRYTVVIGSRGSVKVISNLSQGKEMRIYGRLKDNLRFVNLTQGKGCNPESYSLSDLVAYCKGDEVDLTPLTEEEINTILRDSQPVLKDLTPDEVFSLEQCLDTYGNPTYIDYSGGYTRVYKPVYHTKKSNGFLNYHFSVTTTYDFDDYYTHKQTQPFKDKEVITIHDLQSVDNIELIEIRDLIVQEVERRSKVSATLSEPKHGTHIIDGKVVRGVIGYDMSEELNNMTSSKTDNSNYTYHCEQTDKLS